MNVRQTAVITFRTSLGNQFNLRLNNPVPAFEERDAGVISGQMIEADPFDETVGSLEEMVGAAIVTVTENVVFER